MKDVWRSGRAHDPMSIEEGYVCIFSSTLTRDRGHMRGSDGCLILEDVLWVGVGWVAVVVAWRAACFLLRPLPFLRCLLINSSSIPCVTIERTPWSIAHACGHETRAKVRIH
jgi:hypothetical protein